MAVEWRRRRLSFSHERAAFVEWEERAEIMSAPRAGEAYEMARLR
jgi:hypothetical protein